MNAIKRPICAFSMLTTSLLATVATSNPVQVLASPPQQGNNFQKVVILSEIWVYRTEDSSEDETYLTVDGIKRWQDNMTAGPVTGYNLNDHVGMIVIGTWPIEISLWDEDGPFDNNDLLGTFVFKPDTPLGIGSMRFRQHGADYVIGYTVQTVSNRALAGTRIENSGLVSRNGRYTVRLTVVGKANYIFPARSF